MTIHMALRTIRRHKRRTLIASLSIAFGIVVSVTFTGMGDYSYTNLIDASSKMGFGHTTLAHPDYFKNPTLDKTIILNKELLEKIKNNEYITDYKIRITGSSVMQTARKSVAGAFFAIDPAQETIETNFFLKAMEKGKMFETRDERSVIIGKEMARKLRLKIGKKIVYTTTDKNGDISSDMVRVKGIFSTGSKDLDSQVILLPIDMIRKTLKYEKNESTIVALFIKDQRKAQLARNDINKNTLNNSEKIKAFSWQQTQADLAGIITVDKAMNKILQLLVGLIISAGILNTVLMSVMERKKEFAVMVALGLTPVRLFFLVMVEAFFIAIIGIVLGIIFTTPWYIYMTTIGIDFTEMVGTDYSAGGVLVDPLMKLILFPDKALIIASMAIILTLLASLYPAYKVIKLKVVENLSSI